jgi:chromosome partitioning protein
VIISIAHFKGGAGKTTTSINLASAACRDGQRVLVLDIDQQKSLTSWLASDTPATIADWLRGSTTFGDTVETIRQSEDGSGRIDFIAGDVKLYQLGIALYTQNVQNALDRLLRETHEGRAVHEHYDFVFFDCPPALSHLTYNAMWAADLVLSPAPTERMGIEGLKVVLENIRDVQEKRGDGRPEWLVLPTFYRRNEVTPRKTLENLGTAMGWFPEGRLLEPIDRLADIRDARNVQQTVFEYSPDSRGAKQYEAAYQAVKQFRIPA